MVKGHNSVAHRFLGRSGRNPTTQTSATEDLKLFTPDHGSRIDALSTRVWVNTFAAAGMVLRNVTEACEENILFVVPLLFTADV